LRLKLVEPCRIARAVEELRMVIGRTPLSREVELDRILVERLSSLHLKRIDAHDGAPLLLDGALREASTNSRARREPVKRRASRLATPVLH